MKNLSGRNTLFTIIRQDDDLFALITHYYNSEHRYCTHIDLTIFPNTTEEEHIEVLGWTYSLYLALKAQMDFEERKIGYTNENEYVQWWFETFSTKGDIFKISSDFIDAYEDLQKIINNAE